MGQSMELASLVAGVALASFPYTPEFNGKIKYVRDFFITIFFVGLGMQIPSPELSPILTAALIAVIVLCVRWLGIFTLIKLLGGDTRLAAVATINLSEVSEFALVICSLGMTYGHVEKDTLTILIWVFSLLAIMSANLLPYNYQIYNLLENTVRKISGREGGGQTSEGEEHSHGHRDVVFLGFHKVAATLIYDIASETGHHLIDKIHVVDFNENVLEKLRSKGVGTSYGDISSPDVLEHCVHGEVNLVISTIPDTMLRGTSNMALLKVAKQVWPTTSVIVTADDPVECQKLYNAGADYVLRSSNLCAEKLHEVLAARFESIQGLMQHDVSSKSRISRKSKRNNTGKL